MRLLKVLVIIAFSSYAFLSYAESEEEIIASNMILLLKSAKFVISENQDKINDPKIANKGLTGEVVLAAAKEKFNKSAVQSFESIDPNSRLGKILKMESDAIIEVLDEAQPLINEEGKAFKGFIPAIFARQLADKTSAKLSGQAKIKVTAPKEYVRNRKNNPDEWENSKIEMFQLGKQAKGSIIVENTTINGKEATRYLIPEYYKESCLTCHGTPKGERDITGGIKEGGKIDDLGGLISVIIFK